MDEFYIIKLISNVSFNNFTDIGELVGKFLKILNAKNWIRDDKALIHEDIM
jgi:hypothetical protein